LKPQTFIIWQTSWNVKQLLLYCSATNLEKACLTCFTNSMKPNGH